MAKWVFDHSGKNELRGTFLKVSQIVRKFSFGNWGPFPLVSHQKNLIFRWKSPTTVHKIVSHAFFCHPVFLTICFFFHCRMRIKKRTLWKGKESCVLTCIEVANSFIIRCFLPAIMWRCLWRHFAVGYSEICSRIARARPSSYLKANLEIAYTESLFAGYIGHNKKFGPAKCCGTSDHKLWTLMCSSYR